MQGTKPPTAPLQHKWLPTAPGVCLWCVCVHCKLFTVVCVKKYYGFHKDIKQQKQYNMRWEEKL